MINNEQNIFKNMIPDPVEEEKQHTEDQRNQHREELQGNLKEEEKEKLQGRASNSKGKVKVIEFKNTPIKQNRRRGYSYND